MRGFCLKATHRRQHRSHGPRLLLLIIGLAVHLGLRATWWLYRSARRARLGLGTLDNRAPRARARRALADLARLVACADARRARRHGRLQNVPRHVRRCRALCLEHVPAHIGLLRARRNRGLQNVLGPINLRARHRTLISTCRRLRAYARRRRLPAGIAYTSTVARRLRLSACVACALRNIHKGFANRSAHHNTNHDSSHKKGQKRQQIFQRHITLVYHLICFSGPTESKYHNEYGCNGYACNYITIYNGCDVCTIHIGMDRPACLGGFRAIELLRRDGRNRIPKPATHGVDHRFGIILILYRSAT